MKTKHLLGALLSFLYTIIFFSCGNNDEKKIYSVVVKYCRKYLKYYIMDNKMNFREKIRALLMVVSPVTIRLYVWRKKKTSMLYM